MDGGLVWRRALDVASPGSHRALERRVDRLTAAEAARREAETEVLPDEAVALPDSVPTQAGEDGAAGAAVGAEADLLDTVELERT